MRIVAFSDYPTAICWVVKGFLIRTIAEKVGRAHMFLAFALMFSYCTGFMQNLVI